MSIFVGNLTIPNAADVSNSLASQTFLDSEGVMIYAPSSLDALTFTIQVSPDGSNWSTLHNGTADVAPPAAAKARYYTELGATFVRLKASANVAANRTFVVTKFPKHI